MYYYTHYFIYYISHHYGLKKGSLWPYSMKLTPTLVKQGLLSFLRADSNNKTNSHMVGNIMRALWYPYLRKYA